MDKESSESEDPKKQKLYQLINKDEQASDKDELEEKKKDDANKDETDTCCICMDDNDVDSCKLLHCGHSFHQICLQTWVLTEKQECPVCRSKDTACHHVKHADETLISIVELLRGNILKMKTDVIMKCDDHYANLMQRDIHEDDELVSDVHSKLAAINIDEDDSKFIDIKDCMDNYKKKFDKIKVIDKDLDEQLYAFHRNSFLDSSIADDAASALSQEIFRSFMMFVLYGDLFEAVVVPVRIGRTRNDVDNESSNSSSSSSSISSSSISSNSSVSSTNTTTTTTTMVSSTTTTTDPSIRVYAADDDDNKNSKDSDDSDDIDDTDDINV